MRLVNSAKNAQKNPGFWYTKMQPVPSIQTQNPVQDVLRDFLYINRAISSGAEWNVVGLGDSIIDAGKYSVPDINYSEQFLKPFHDTTFESGFSCSLLERHLPHGGPILIDLDFMYESNDLQRRFTDVMIRKFVIGYVRILLRFFDMSAFKHLHFFVLTKDGPELKNNKQKDGIHIHCPDLTLTPEEQYILRGYLLQQKLIQNIFDETGFINAEHDVFDVSAIHRNGWFLYGASKPNNSPYKLQKIYLASTDHDILEEEDIDKYETLDLTYLLSIRFGHEIPTALPVVEISKPEWTALGNMWANGKSTPNTIAFE